MNTDHIAIRRTTEFLKGLTHYEALTPQTDLVASGLLNSLILMDLLTFLDREFHIRLQASDLTPENLANVETIVYRLVSRPALRDAS